MRDITCVGEILIDLTQTEVSETGVPQFAANPSGAPNNVAVAAARLKAKTAFVGKVGLDGFERYLRQVLRDNGVDGTGLGEDTRPTTMVIVSVDGSGEREFQFVRGADASLTPGEIHEEIIAGSKFLHFGSVSLTADPARTATLSAARCHGAN